MTVRRTIGLLLAAGTLGACGTTVPTSSSGSPLGDGLSTARPAPGIVTAPGPSSDPGPAEDVPAPEGLPPASRSPGAALDPVPTSTSLSSDREPIKVGLLYTLNDAAPTAGIDTGNTFTPKAAFDGLVRAYNARGGLAGRRIVPVSVELRSSSTTLESDLQAACSRFTQDDRVALVLSAVGIYSEAFSQCLARAGTPQLSGDYALGDEVAMGSTPRLVAVATLTVDQRMRLLLERMSQQGRLSRSARVGVVIEGCPYNERAYTRTVVPTARRLGLTIADVARGRCFEGISNFGGLASDMQAAVLRFQSSRVSHVVLLSGGVEGNLMLLFATAAEAQAYRPGYLLTSAVAAAVQEGNTPQNQLANAVGLGWLPPIDSSRSSLAGAAAKRCLQDLRTGAGVSPQSPADRYYATSACDVFGLADHALRVTRGSADPAGLVAAISTAGFRASAVYGEAIAFAGGRRTGPARGRVFAWSTGCGCFGYAGPDFSLLGG